VGAPPPRAVAPSRGAGSPACGLDGPLPGPGDSDRSLSRPLSRPDEAGGRKAAPRLPRGRLRLGPHALEHRNCWRARKMANDEILDELHRVREQLVVEAGGDIAGLFRLLRGTARVKGQAAVTLPAKVPAVKSSEAPADDGAEGASGL